MKKLKAAEIEAFDGFLSKKQAAELLGIAVSTLNHWIVDGCAPPYFKVRNRFVRFREEDVRKFIQITMERRVG